MFTGIVKDIGRVEKIEKRAGKTVLHIATKLSGSFFLGDSLSVNGCCLTVSKKQGDCVFVEATAPTLQNTTLGSLKTRDRINVEPALRMQDPLGGHIVLGHIDTVGVVRSFLKKRDFSVLSIAVSPVYQKYLVEKGSITIDGVSLTLYSIRSAVLTVTVIPVTLRETILANKRAGDKVNIEFDYLAKLVAGLLAARGY